MKFSALISVLFICFVFAACASDEEETTCVTAFDCPDGYSCVDSVCQPGTPQSDVNSDYDSDTTDEIPPSGDSDDVLPGEDSDLPEIPDDIQSCPNACSGFGECNFETGKCACDETHQGEDCSECKEGYHLEAEDDDEDGNPDVRSCMPNITCNPNPCNNNGCREEGDTVKCTCTAASHAAGRWCDECAEGYAKSNVDGTCKEDCSKKTCTAPQKCGMDYTTNEASCNQCENEFYSGADCKSCDTEHFCNGHGTACVVEGGTEKCTCETAYAGDKCNTCANGYFQSNGSCIKSCDTNTCFKTRQCEGTVDLGFMTMDATGSGTAHGTCNNTTGGCDCEPGWFTGTSASGVGTDVTCDSALLSLTIDTFHNVECAICDKNNPPSQYASSGCPQELTGDTSLCNSIYSFTFCGMGGSCYYEPTGAHQLYCVCSDGYHLDNGDKYSGYCVADE